jgi:hypothetical protein
MLGRRQPSSGDEDQPNVEMPLQATATTHRAFDAKKRDVAPETPGYDAQPA